jgi:hypothetical protein
MATARAKAGSPNANHQRSGRRSAPPAENRAGTGTAERTSVDAAEQAVNPPRST